MTWGLQLVNWGVRLVKRGVRLVKKGVQILPPEGSRDKAKRNAFMHRIGEDDINSYFRLIQRSIMRREVSENSP